MIRRRRDEVKGINYTQRIHTIHPVELSWNEKKAYEEVVDLLFLNYLDFNGIPINTALAAHSILPKITSSSRSSMEFLENLIKNPKYHMNTIKDAQRILERFRSITNDSKLEKLMEVINGIKKKSKILIYTKHPATLKYISETLKKQKFSITEFKGGLTSNEKTKKIQEFKEKTQIMISTDTGSEGLNLQFCSNIINYDLPWNPMVVEQRIGRLDRIGQKKNISIYNLATKGTMEEHIVDLIINKMCCIGLIMGELPIILFNMGLDSKGKSNSTKFEEKIMTAFINSKNNLNRFSNEIDKISREISKGIKEYDQTKKHTSQLLDNEN